MLVLECEFMDRVEAVALLKELFDMCPSLEGKSFAIMPPQADSLLSKDHQIHITTTLNEETLLCVRRAIKRHDHLALLEEKDRIILYRPAGKVK